MDAPRRDQKRAMRQRLIFGTLLAILVTLGLRPTATQARGGATHLLSVRAALQLCSHARARATTRTPIVAAPRVWVRGYFLRVIGNGYTVAGEPGSLYDRMTRTTPEGEPAPGGLAVGVPVASFPHGIPTARWVHLHGTLKCARFPGQILTVDAWHPWRHR